MRLGLVVVAVLCGNAGLAHADERAPRRRQIGTRIAYVGLTASLTAIAVGAFAIGLGNDRPDAARPFFAIAWAAGGIGVAGLGTGVYLRATSPRGEPDPVALDPVRGRHRNERRAGLAIGGLGASVLATGIAHAVGAWRNNELAQPHCPNGACDANGTRLLARAHTLSLAADMLIGTGAIALAGGIILYRGGRDTNRIIPVVDAQLVGAAVLGRF